MKKRFSFKLIQKLLSLGILAYTIVFFAFNKQVVFEQSSLYYKISFILIILLNFFNTYARYIFVDFKNSKLNKYVYFTIATILLIMFYSFIMIGFNGSIYTIEALPEAKSIYILVLAACMLLVLVLFLTTDELMDDDK